MLKKLNDEGIESINHLEIISLAIIQCNTPKRKWSKSDIDIVLLHDHAWTTNLNQDRRVLG